MGKFGGYGTKISAEELKTIRPMPGWVLLRPVRNFLDNVFTTPSGLLINTMFSTNENAILQARVLAVCDNLGYSDTTTHFRAGSGTIGAKVEYDVEIDVEAGDMVMCRYLAIKNAVEEWRILISEDEDDFYVLVNHDSLVLAERESEKRSIPMNGYHIIEELKTIKVVSREIDIPDAVKHKSEITEGIVRIEPDSMVYAHFWEEMRVRRMTKCGYRVTKDPAYVDKEGVRHPEKITGCVAVGGNPVEGSFPYRDHGQFGVGTRVIFANHTAPLLDNQITPSGRGDKYKKLRRVHEKDICAFRKDGRVWPNKMRVIIQPDKAEDYLDRLKKLAIPDNQKKLPWSGLVTAIWSDEEDDYFNKDLLGKKLRFYRKPEHIFKQDGRVMFVVNLNHCV